MTSHPVLRQLMEDEHAFLYKLYRQRSGRVNRTSLENATKDQIWVVLRLLFCITVGHIPLAKINYARLVRSKRRNTLRSLKNRMKNLRKSQVQTQRKFVLQFAALYPYLFYDLFNEA